MKHGGYLSNRIIVVSTTIEIIIIINGSDADNASARYI
jgi:hypothetical protein